MVKCPSLPFPISFPNLCKREESVEASVDSTFWTIVGCVKIASHQPVKLIPPRHKFHMNEQLDSLHAHPSQFPFLLYTRDYFRYPLFGESHFRHFFLLARSKRSTLRTHFLLGLPYRQSCPPSRLRVPLGADSGAHALLSALSTGVGSAAAIGVSSALRTGGIPHTFL